MNPSFSKKMAEYLQSADKDSQKDMHFILAKVNELNKINQKVIDTLPQNLTKNCQVAQLKQKKLILLAPNGSIATQIRYEARELLQKWQQDPFLKDIQEIECKVSPTFSQLMMPTISQSESPFKKMAFISERSAKIIHEIAETLSDPALKKVMERIATRTKEKEEG